jgi:hypothetical protein
MGTKEAWTPEMRVAQAERMRLIRQRPDFLEKRRLGIAKSEIYGAAHAAVLVRLRQDPEFEIKRREGMSKSEVRREQFRQRRAEPGFRAAQLEGLRNKRPRAKTKEENVELRTADQANDLGS